jgi:hypothetical protein
MIKRMDIGTFYLESAIKRFKEYKGLGDKTIEQLEDAEMHFQPNAASNSIAIIIQHMYGNMLSRWTNFLSEDGEKEWRKRDEEFEESKLSKEDLIKRWEEGWSVVLDTLEQLSSDDLLKTIYIRKQPLTVVDAINRQLAHYCGHVGQIIYLGKIIKSESWQTLSIPKNGSKAFNDRLMK